MLLLMFYAHWEGIIFLFICTVLIKPLCENTENTVLITISILACSHPWWKYMNLQYYVEWTLYVVVSWWWLYYSFFPHLFCKYLNSFLAPLYFECIQIYLVDKSSYGGNINKGNMQINILRLCFGIKGYLLWSRSLLHSTSGIDSGKILCKWYVYYNVK